VEPVTCGAALSNLKDRGLMSTVECYPPMSEGKEALAYTKQLAVQPPQVADEGTKLDFFTYQDAKTTRVMILNTKPKSLDPRCCTLAPDLNSEPWTMHRTLNPKSQTLLFDEMQAKKLSGIFATYPAGGYVAKLTKDNGNQTVKTPFHLHALIAPNSILKP